MDFESVPASNYSLSDLVKLLNRGFEGYFIPIHFSHDMFSNMLRIDCAPSRIPSQPGCGDGNRQRDSRERSRLMVHESADS
jgi:hypothetical protein